MWMNWNMHTDYVCMWSNSRTGRKVNGREGGIPSCLICSTVSCCYSTAPVSSLTSAQRTLHPPIPAKQEARSFFLQFVTGATHRKCFKYAVPSHPLNECTCKLCFGKLERARSLQHWWWLNNLHGNAYIYTFIPSKKRLSLVYNLHWTFQTNSFGGSITSHSYSPTLLAAHCNTSQYCHGFAVSLCIVIGCPTFHTKTSQGWAKCCIVTRLTFAGSLAGGTFGSGCETIFCEPFYYWLPGLEATLHFSCFQIYSLR